MKTLKTLMSLFVLMAAFSCAKSPAVSEGYITFALSQDEIVADVVTKSSVSDYASLPSVNDFVLEIKDASGVTFWNGKLSEWDPATKMTAGNYTATATYGVLEEEGFGKPFFTGEKGFTVNKGETISVQIPVALGNTIIKIACTDKFKAYYPDYSFRLVRGATELAAFAKDETRAAFIDGYKVTLEGTVTTESGSQKGFTISEYKNLSAATAYTITVDVANVGGSAVTVSFNHGVETVELGDVELND